MRRDCSKAAKRRSAACKPYLLLYEITDADTIRSVLDAILQIRIEKETDLMSTDYDDIFVFTMADGTQCSFSFNNHHFQINKTLYELSNDDDLWKLAKDLQH